MRKVIYICDTCGKEYPYELQAGEKDRDILINILGKDLCRKCSSQIKQILWNK
jgi:DNA-directed RNA polymerase subunit RPC12/RpoP